MSTKTRRTQEHILDALREPAAYAHPTGRIRTIRTHVSMVFLAGDLAYKVKRDVRFPFLDLSTLERRRLCCEEEVRLNRRLSPELYLGVVAITVDAAGGIHVGGAGEIVEYAVKMRRLPEDQMMDSLVSAGRLAPDAIARICERLVPFHAQAAATEAIAAFGSPSAIAELWEEHFIESSPLVGDFLDRFQEGLLRATARAWMVGKRPLLERRHRNGSIRDGHGDLRCSSICLTEPIQIFDCLEFSPRLRCADVASDVAFLAMDLTWRGRRDLADELVGRYSKLAGDAELGRLVPFYGCYRACVRAKVSALSARDAQVTAPERASCSRSPASTLARIVRPFSSSSVASPGPGSRPSRSSWDVPRQLASSRRTGSGRRSMACARRNGDLRPSRKASTRRTRPDGPTPRSPSRPRISCGRVVR